MNLNKKRPQPSEQPESKSMVKNKLDRWCLSTYGDRVTVRQFFRIKTLCALMGKRLDLDRIKKLSYKEAGDYIKSLQVKDNEKLFKDYKKFDPGIAPHPSELWR